MPELPLPYSPARSEDRLYIPAPVKCEGLGCHAEATKHVTDKGQYVASFCAKCFPLEYQTLLGRRYPLA
jgi:hypothetical protein